MISIITYILGIALGSIVLQNNSKDVENPIDKTTINNIGIAFIFLFLFGLYEHILTSDSKQIALYILLTIFTLFSSFMMLDNNNNTDCDSDIYSLSAIGVATCSIGLISLLYDMKNIL